MFCIKCGKEALKDNMCEDCFLEKKELFKIKPIKLRYCKDCEKYYSQTEKIKADDIEQFLETKIVALNEIKKIDFRLNKKTDRIEGEIIAKGLVKPSKRVIEDIKKIKIQISGVKCENCVKISGNYHEAVLQVRGTDKDRILKKLSRVLLRNEIANIHNLKEGYDILLVSKAPAAHAAKELSASYDIKQSFKFIGEKKGKKIYRNFYSIR
jgi:NMD protein affecting ribosome stability and mRNA decay